MSERIGLEAIFDIGDFERNAKKYNRTVDGLNKNTRQASSGISSSFSGISSSLSTIATGAAIGGVTALGLAVVKFGKDSISTAISFESAFAGVVKTTDGLTSGIGVLNAEGKDLRQGFVDLSREIPVTFEELAKIGELGGQLGVPKEALLDFTETVAALGVATNLSTEDAATSIARMANIYNIAAGDMGQNTRQVGSAIVALGNNFATTESEITNFANRVAGAGKIAGLTQADVLGIGTAFSSVGVEAEAGGTAVQKVLIGINTSVAQGGEKLTKFANVAGLSAEEFRARWEQDAAGAFQLFVQGLASQGDNAVTVLEDLGLADQRLIRAFLSLSESGDLLGNAIRQSNVAFAEGTALQDEAAQRYATTESRIQILKNTFSELGDTVGSLVMPAINQAITDTIPVIDTVIERTKVWDAIINDMVPNIKTLETNVATLAGKNAFLAQSQDDFINVVTDGRKDMDAFSQSLIKNSSSYEEYDKILGELTAVYPALLVEIDGSEKAFNAARATIDQENKELQINTEAARLAGAAAFYLAQQQDVAKSAISDTISVIEAQTSAIDRQRAAFAEQAAAQDAALLQTRAGQFGAQQVAPGTIQTADTFAEKEAAAEAQKALESAGSAGVSAANKIKDAFQNAFDDLKSIVESQVVPTLDEVWKPPDGARFDEDARRLATVSTAGFSSEWLNQLNSQYAGLEFFQPITDAINAGDETALKEAANAILTDNVTALWNTDVIKESVRRDIQQKQLKQGIVDTVTEELAAEGAIVLPSDGGISTGIVDAIGVGVMDKTEDIKATGQAITDNIFLGMTENAENAEVISSLFTTILDSIKNMPLALPTATEAINVFFENLTTQTTTFTEGVWLTLETRFQTFILTTLPQLQSTYTGVFQQMINITQQLVTVVTQLVAVINQIGPAIQEAADAVKEAAEEMTEAFEDVGDSIEKYLLPGIRQAIKLMEELEEKASSAASSVRDVATATGTGGSDGIGLSKGIGFTKGIGFQGGLGLGMTIPAGFNNDSFGPLFVESGEQMLVTPRGTSIDEVVFGRLANLMGGIGRQVTVNINVGSINNGMDLAMLQNTIRQTVAQGFG